MLAIETPKAGFFLQTKITESFSKDPINSSLPDKTSSFASWEVSI
jgi:hypothetical protein